MVCELYLNKAVILRRVMGRQRVALVIQAAVGDLTREAVERGGRGRKPARKPWKGARCRLMETWLGLLTSQAGVHLEVRVW